MTALLHGLVLDFIIDDGLWLFSVACFDGERVIGSISEKTILNLIVSGGVWLKFLVLRLRRYE